MAWDADEKCSPFLALPAEIRCQIYLNLFSSSRVNILPQVGNPYIFTVNCRDSHHEMLLACRQIRSEALPVYTSIVRVSILGPAAWTFVRFHWAKSRSPVLKLAEHIIDKSSRPQFEKDGRVVRDIFPHCKILEYWGHYEASSRQYAEHPMAWWILESADELRDIESGSKDAYFISGGEGGGGRNHAEQQRWLQAFSWYWGRGQHGISGTVNERPVREVGNSRYCVWVTELILYHPDCVAGTNGFPKGLAGYRFTYNLDTGETVRRTRVLSIGGDRNVDILLTP